MKRVLLLLPLIAMVFTAKGQDETADDKKKKKAELLFGIEAGFNYARIAGESESYDGGIFGPHFGMIVNLLHLSKVLRVNAGLSYSAQGGGYSYNTEDDYEPIEGSGKVKLNYINMPILAHYETPGGFFAEAGVQPAILVSAKDKYEYNGNSGSQDIKDQLKKVDVGIPLGVGYSSKSGLGVSLRAVPGLCNINKNNSMYENNKDRNFTVSLRATYTL